MWHPAFVLLLIISLGWSGPARANDRAGAVLAYIDRDILSWVGDARLLAALRGSAAGRRGSLPAAGALLSARVGAGGGQILHAALHGAGGEPIVATGSRNYTAGQGQIIDIPRKRGRTPVIDGARLARTAVGPGDILSFQVTDPANGRLLGSLRIAIDVGAALRVAARTGVSLPPPIR
jgi:hypothetical protein